MELRINSLKKSFASVIKTIIATFLTAIKKGCFLINKKPNHLQIINKAKGRIINETNFSKSSALPNEIETKVLDILLQLFFQCALSSWSCYTFSRAYNRRRWRSKLRGIKNIY